MTHYLRFDTRIEVVKNIISPFQLHLNKIREICKKDNFNYWDSIYADDTEHFVGTVFIVLQNYINSSISDLFPELTRLHKKYVLDKTVNNSQTTRIQLIIAIANFYKHRDLSEKLFKHTEEAFIDLNIEYIEEVYNTPNDKYIYKVGSCSPIFLGFSLLSEFWDFNDLINIVSEWRENMWLNEEEIIKITNDVP